MQQEIDVKHSAKLPTALFIETLCFLPHVTIALVCKDWGKITLEYIYWQIRLKNRFPELLASQKYNADILKRIYRVLFIVTHLKLNVDDILVKDIDVIIENLPDINHLSQIYHSQLIKHSDQKIKYHFLQLANKGKFLTPKAIQTMAFSYKRNSFSNPDHTYQELLESSYKANQDWESAYSLGDYYKWINEVPASIKWYEIAVSIMENMEDKVSYKNYCVQKELVRPLLGLYLTHGKKQQYYDVINKYHCFNAIYGNWEFLNENGLVETPRRVLQERWHGQMLATEDKEVKKIYAHNLLTLYSHTSQSASTLFPWLTSSQLRELSNECRRILELPTESECIHSQWLLSRAPGYSPSQPSGKSSSQCLMM